MSTFSPRCRNCTPKSTAYVTVDEVTSILRIVQDGYFRGVATVCAKLFHMVKPHIAIFGKKDFQQLVTIKRMVADLNIDLEIVGMPTTREKDGLAMSSRNVYLSSEERESALCLSRSLQRAKKQYEEGERDAVRILDSVKKYIENVPFARIDYLKICSTETMQDVKNLDKESVLALAVYIGLTRLIDNYVFGEDLNLN